MVCLAVFISLPLQAKRVALVMGNDNYTSVSKLQKAGNDATAMARELKAAGFTVQLHKDLNYRGMVRAVEAFTNNITGGDEVVVFFAGHGVQIRNGSYLLPTDIEANSESEVEKTAYELLALTDKISEAKPAFSLVMVDACRDNPLKSKGRNIGNARGLSAIEPPKGQMVVYSASRGQQALDRLSDKDPNPNGVFTREFITQMQKPGVRIEDIMRSVQDSVETLAKSVSHEQRPAVYNEARGNFYFFGPTTVQVTPAQQKPDTNALELAFWDSVKTAATIGEIQAYLNRFPNGFFAELARLRIASMNVASAEKSAVENAQKLATENAQRIENEKVRIESDRKLAAEQKEQLRLAQEAMQKEQERQLAYQNAKEQLRIAEETRLKEQQRIAFEALRLEVELSQQLAKQKADVENQKRLTEEKNGQGVAERFTPSTASNGRLGNLVAQDVSSTKAEDANQIKQAVEAEESEHKKYIKLVGDRILSGNVGSVFKDCDVCPEMVVIPAGSFQMGSSSSWFSSEKPPENEQPARNVSIKNFAMGRFEVTQKQWRELMGTSPSKFKGNDLPVEQISREDAQKFIEKLSVKTGHAYRLPSEAEWEFAALAGLQTEYPLADASKKLSDVAWYWENAEGETRVVGTRSANKFGLFDMFGNVDEWTADCYNSNYKNAPTNGSTWSEGSCQFGVVRGGSWAKPARFLRSKHRDQVSKEAKDDTLGFRVARDFMK